MTRDEIIRMASDCGLMMRDEPMHGVERFAEMVAAAEREACAKVCERKSMVKGGEVFAAAIRGRGEK